MSINKNIMYASFGDPRSRDRKLKPSKNRINDDLRVENLLIHSYNLTQKSRDLKS